MRGWTLAFKLVQSGGNPGDVRLYFSFVICISVTCSFPGTMISPELYLICASTKCASLSF